MKRLIRPLTIALIFLGINSFSGYANQKLNDKTNIGFNLTSMESFKNSNLKKVKKELSGIITYVEKTKQAAREIVSGRFLMNESEIDCHGNVPSVNQFSGLVSFETRSNGDLVIHGFNSVFSEKDDLTIILKLSDSGEKMVSVFSANSATEISVNETGSGSYKKLESGEFSNSISWNEKGNGTWAKMSKSGKFSSGNFGTDFVADSEN